MERITVKLGDSIVGDDHPPVLVLEAGATHRGLIDAKWLTRSTPPAAGIKFQTLWADNMMSSVDSEIEYDDSTGKHRESLYKLLKQRELQPEEWIELAEYARSINVFWFTSPDSPETIDMLLSHGLGAIKIMGGDMTYHQLIDHAARTGLPILLDSRGTLKEVSDAVQVCERAGNRNIIIVHCPSGYPAPSASLGLIKVYRDVFPYPVGFSDHSPKLNSSIQAVALGASFIEKCVSSDPTRPGVENIMSIHPDQVRDTYTQLLSAWSDCRDDKPSWSIPARRSVVLKQLVKKGEVVTADNVVFKRPGAGIPPFLAATVIDRRARVDIQPDVPVEVGDLVWKQDRQSA